MEMKSATMTSTTNEKVSSNYIPDDVVLSILSKLPLKSLNRFECVRKSWSLLFENTRFVKMFYNNLLSNSRTHCSSYYDGASLILKAYETNQDVLYSLSGENFEKKVKLGFSNPFINQNYFYIFGFGSVNGTFCILDEECCNYKIVLWNLESDEFKVIPQSPVELIESFIPDVVGKDSISIGVLCYHHGFGYDSVVDDYKIIRYVCFLCNILEPMEDEYLDSLLRDVCLDPIWEIYSVRSNSWRKLDVDMPYSLECSAGTHVYMDGVCHWLCEDLDNGAVGPCLVSFYLSNEVFIITGIPSEIDDCLDESLWTNLVVLNGSVALISPHVDTTTFYISILGEFGIKESWTRLFTVGPLSCVLRPIGVGMKGEIFFIRKDGELAWFDPSTQKIEVLGFKALSPSCRIIIYKENILPIGGISS